jgi:signal transduction histidine kinase
MTWTNLARWGTEPDSIEDVVKELSGPGALELVVEMAHDLRSPLSSILLLTEVLMRGESGVVNDVQRRQLRVLYRAALSLTATTNDVIEMAEGGGTLVHGEPTEFSSRELLESVADMVRPIAEDKGIDVRVAVGGDGPRVGHPAALSRVLLNLSTNALKFTDDGYVEMAATRAGAQALAFSVRDTGCGMAPARVETLFSPFRPSPVLAEPVLCRTGLGLGICRRLLQAMGSTLEVETRPGWGTRFRFELNSPSATRLQPS